MFANADDFFPQNIKLLTDSRAAWFVVFAPIVKNRRIYKEASNDRIEMGGNRHHKTMNKKDNIQNKDAVSASSPMTCSADGHRENAERERKREERQDKK